MCQNLGSNFKVILFFGPTVDPNANSIFSIETIDSIRYLRSIEDNKALAVCIANLKAMMIIVYLLIFFLAITYLCPIQFRGPAEKGV